MEMMQVLQDICKTLEVHDKGNDTTNCLLFSPPGLDIYIFSVVFM